MAQALETRAPGSALGLDRLAGEPLRVLSVIPGEAEGASMIFAKRQVAALQDVGVISELFLLSSRTSPGVLITEWQQLRRMIRDFRPDLIHAHFGTMTAFFCMFSGKVPLVITYRGTDLNLSPDVSRLRSIAGRLLSQVAALRASRIICVSEALKGKLFWAKNRVSVVPSGVDTRIFRPRPRNAARLELGWPTEGRAVLFNAGRNPAVKRLDLAQAAFEVAEARCGKIQFVVLDGYTDRDSVPTLMNASDCLLLTSDSEGSPNIVKEAMACNLPVVSVDVGDVRERLSTVSPSRIVARDPDELGAALVEILRSGERSNGHLAIASLSQQKVAMDILSVYQAALNRATAYVSSACRN